MTDPKQFISSVADFLAHDAKSSQDLPRAQERAKPPLKRRVTVRTPTWRRWLTTKHLEGYPDLPADVRQIADELLKDHDIFVPESNALDSYIGRESLVGLSQTAKGTDTDEARIRLWIATMMWGSGKTNSRGLWNTRKSLADSALREFLQESSQRVAIPEPEAYNVNPGTGKPDVIHGVLLPFRSKWFWSASLASDNLLRPLILDSRVRATLNAFSPKWGDRILYSDYIRLMHRTAQSIDASLDGESIEHLLFEDRNGSGGAMTLSDWFLGNR